MKRVTIKKDGKPLRTFSGEWPDGARPAGVSVTVTATMDTEALRAIVVHNDECRVRELLDYAEREGLPNLRIWCKVWLDPTSDAARERAARMLRGWVELGDTGKDASL